MRVSDDIILSSVSSERYLHLSNRFHTKIIEEEVEQVEGSSRFLRFLISIFLKDCQFTKPIWENLVDQVKRLWKGRLTLFRERLL